MKRAGYTRYTGQKDARLEQEGNNKRKATSSTLNQSLDGRRLISSSKPIELPSSKASSARPSALLDSMLNNLPGRSSDRNPNPLQDFEFGANFSDFERDFYDTNAGGFDDDYVETNEYIELQPGAGGGAEAERQEPEVMVGLDEDGWVDNPLLTWLPHRQEYVDELLRYGGRGHWKNSTHCPGCGSSSSSPIIRCDECFGRQLLCEDCTRARHQFTPYHRIKRWTGRYFVPDSLARLGVIVRLGPHVPGTECPTGQTLKEFTIIHTNGIHSATVEICHCGSPEVHPRVQLLHAGIYPATVLSPQSGATFEAMRLFHLLSLQGKLTAYDFIHTLEIYTDNTGLYPPPARLQSFMHMAREWRHVKMLIRAGRGHAKAGVKTTKKGELSVWCPACPRPNENLRSGWELVPKRDRQVLHFTYLCSILTVTWSRWLYRLILSMDANFRLKNRLRTSSKTDPGLGTGWAYFVPDEEYKQHVLKYATQEEISTCSGFEALSNANQKNIKGLRSTGVGALVCARHTFWRPAGMGDLQKGERYCNMDFVFTSGVGEFILLQLLLTYDVICQWKIKFFSERVAGLPPSLRPAFGPEAIQFAVPKFHLPPHEAKCQAPHSLNFKPGAGETDGEGIERNWALTNGAAASTKEMGPGARHDTLDDHCGHANWRKLVTMSDLLERRLDNAMYEGEEHIGIFKEFTSDLDEKHGDQVVEWRRSIMEWEATDMSGASPYDLDGEVVTLAMVTRRHAETEAVQVLEWHNIIPGRSAFLLEGIAIEDSQRELAHRLKAKTKPTDTQAASFKDQQTHLLRRIQCFRGDQDTHMPRVASLIAPQDNPSDSSHSTRAPETVQLYMPSNIAANIRPTYCDGELCSMEKDIRYACAIDALGELRRALHLRVYVNKLKIKNVVGQRENTRARSMQDTIEHRVSTAANKYHQARLTYISLTSEEEGAGLRELKKEDITGLGERAVAERERREVEATRERLGRGAEAAEGLQQDEAESLSQVAPTPQGAQPTSGESRRHISWLWYSGGLEVDDNTLSREMNDGVRVEWLKSRARAQRWEEEVRLLREEMERVLRAFEWEASRWEERTERLTEQNDVPDRGLGADEELREGLEAYAAEHAEMYRGMRSVFEAKWKLVYDASQIFLARNSVLDED